MTEAIDLAAGASLTDAALSPSRAGELATVFKALSDPVRLRLLSLVTSADGEICVCDLTAAFALTNATISHHLKVLRDAGLVDSQRRGTWVYYRPLRERLREVGALLDVD